MKNFFINLKLFFLRKFYLPLFPILRRKKIGKFFRKGLPLFILLVLLDGFIYEPYFAIHSEYSEILAPNWTDELSKMKIAVVGDFHAGSGSIEKWRLQKIIEEINKQELDLVLLVGDYVNRQTWVSSMDIALLVDELAKIKASIGIFAVSGNHDEEWALNSLIVNFERVGIRFLNNESVKVSSKFGDFYVAGVRDISNGDFDFFSALEKVPEKSPCILLTHEPEIYPALPLKASVTFAGHTHGGQVRLPFVGAVLNTKLMPFREDNIGLFVNHRDSPIFITRGVGTTRIPVRFLCTPVVDIIRLVPLKK